MISRYFVAGLLCLAFTTTAATAATITLTPIVDGEIHQTAAGQTVDTSLESITTSMSGPNNVKRGVFGFDLSNIPEGAMINSVTLKLTTSALISNVGSTATISFLGYGDESVNVDLGDWNAGSLVATETYNTGGATPIGTVLCIDIDDVDTIQELIDGNNFANSGSGITNPYSIRTQTENFVTFRVLSNEGGSLDVSAGPILQPHLVIDFTASPVPVESVSWGEIKANQN